jgi:hypothetical protein
VSARAQHAELVALRAVDLSLAGTQGTLGALRRSQGNDRVPVVMFLTVLGSAAPIRYLVRAGCSPADYGLSRAATSLSTASTRPAKSASMSPSAAISSASALLALWSAT